MSKSKTDSRPAQQGETAVGPGHPPEEHRWKKGESGNPAGSPKAKTNLYKHMAKYAGMTDAELAQLDLESLTQSEKAALKIVQDMAAGKRTGAGDLARYIIDREEGKTPDRHVVEGNSLPPVDPEGRAEWLERYAAMELAIGDVTHAICYG